MTKNMGMKKKKTFPGNTTLEIRLNTEIDSSEARAISVKYHLKYCTKGRRRETSQEEP